jgi:hypothetical protein
MRRGFYLNLMRPILATLTALVIVGCGDDIMEHWQALKDCEVVSNPNERRCRKKEIPKGVSYASDRRYFQSRDVVYLGISDQLIDFGNFFSVINSSTDKVLIDNVPVPKQKAEFEGFSLFENTRVKVRIHPAMNPNYYLWRGVENDLRVVSRKGLNGDFRYNMSIIHFADYNWFGPQAIAVTNSNDDDDAGYKAELWISEQQQPTVYSSDTAVTVGGFSAINPVY